MAALVATVHFLSIFSVIILAIHVPGENVDKKTLTSLGIKTIGWQSSESTSNNSKNVSVYHNYSKTSLQNKHFENFPQYSQPQLNYVKKPNDLPIKKGGNKGPRPSSSSFQQEDHTELNGNDFSPFSKTTGQEKYNFSGLNDGEPIDTEFGQQRLTDNSNKVVSQTRQKNSYGSHSSSSGNTLTLHFQQQSSKSSSDNQKYTQNANNYQNDLELSRITAIEKQNRESLASLGHDQQSSETTNILEQKTPPYSFQSKQVNSDTKTSLDPKSYLHKNVETFLHAMVSYTKCPEGVTGQLIYKSSCQQFLNCWKGRGFAQNCAAGTLFNPQTLECDFASKVKCLTNPNTPHSEKYTNFNAALIHEVGIHCPPGFFGVVPHKTDCSKFINCANGVQNVMMCPPGTLFSLKINNCDYPLNAECAGWSLEFGTNNVFGHGSNVDQVYEASRKDEHFSGSLSGERTSEWEITQQALHGAQTGGSHLNGNDYVHASNSQLTNQKTSEVYHKDNYHGSNINAQHSYSNAQNQNVNQNSADHYTGTETFIDQNPIEDYNNYRESKTNTGFGSENYQNVHFGSEFPVNSDFAQGQNSNFRGSNSNTHYADLESANKQNGYFTRKGSDYNTQGTNFAHESNQNGYITSSGLVLGHSHGQNQNIQTGHYDYDISTQQKIDNQYTHQRKDIVNENIQKVNYGQQQVVDRTPKCPHGASGLYPHPTICAKFLNCANGITFIQDCGPGTVFNPRAMVCDFPYNVDCTNYVNAIDVKGEVKQPSYGGSTHNDQQSSGTSHTQHEKNDELEEASSNVYGKHIPGGNTVDYGNVNKNQENVKTGDEKVKCPNQPVGFYPHPTACTKYFICSNGKPIIYKCATGTVFNPVNKLCEVQRIVQCYEAANKIYYTGNINEQNNEQIDSSTNIYSRDLNPSTYQENQEFSTENNLGTDNSNIFEHNQGSNQQSGTFGQTNYENKSKPLNQGQGGSLDNNSKFKECDIQDFYCSTSLCIPKSMECDGTKDCPNGVDEQNCGKFLNKFTIKGNSVLAMRENERYSNISLLECAKACLDSKGFKCKSFSYRKDAECFLSDYNIGLCGALIGAEPYTYYELASLTLDCSNLYKCPNNKCINHTQICDGVDDCGDRTDEKGCPAEKFGYQIRLAGTNNKHEGRIEMKAFGKWGFICDDRFGMRDADVVCRELGYPLGALEIKGNSYYAKEVDASEVLYLMDDVVCLGNETSIKDCDFNGWGVSNCEPQEIVGVVCKTPTEKCPKDQFKCDSVQECIPLVFVCDNVFDCPDQSDEVSKYCEATTEIRLVNGKTDREGRVEIRHHGIWGTVCDDDFNDDAGKVVCNTLGYPGKAVVKKDGFFGAGEGPIWLDQVFCQGNESLLQQCTHWNWGEHNCEHTEDVGVLCGGNGIISNPIEIDTEKKSNLDSPFEVPPAELLPTDCGLRKNAVFYVDEVNFRVVQGSVAKKGFYPWQASLRIKNNAKPSHWCGSVVISRKYVLTAAHCLRGFSKGSYVVVAGDYNTDEDEGTEQEIYIEEFYIHEEFAKGQKMTNDIALVKLKGVGFTFTKDIQPICLPESDTAYTNQLNCTISGFGSVQTGTSGYSHDLRAGWVPIQPPEVCKMPHVYGTAITDGMFCAGSLDEGVDACEGDSGGPLACLHNGVFTLYGITSWGQHCGHANKPGVYVKVSHYRDWIETTMRRNAF